MYEIRARIDGAVNDHFRSMGGNVVFSTQTPLFYLPLQSVPKRWRKLYLRFLRATNPDAFVAHVNYRTFHTALTSFEPMEGAGFFESGSSAYGTNSTALLSTVAEILDCSFDTVDINPDTSRRAGALLKQQNHTAHCEDSVDYLERSTHRYCFAYLDSFDLVQGQFEQAAQHGLSEFKALQGKLSPGAVVLIDDTPRSLGIFRSIADNEQTAHAREWLDKHGRMPGKGADVVDWVRLNTGFEILEWGYQLVVRYRPI